MRETAPSRLNNHLSGWFDFHICTINSHTVKLNTPCLSNRRAWPLETVNPASHINKQTQIDPPEFI